jgi:hypothetical protein
MKSKLSAARTAFSIIALASSLLMHDAIANPVTIQLQEDGVNGGAITTVAAGDGLANVAGLSRMACSGSISPATVATQPRACSRRFATIVGDQYQLSYWIGNTTGGGIFGTTSTVNVSLNGAPTFSDTNATSSPTTQNWEQFTHTFVATGTATTLAFLNGDPGGDNNNGLDNIVLTDLGPAPPVPGPVAGAGLPGLIFASDGVLGWWRRRQNKKENVSGHD